MNPPLLSIPPSIRRTARLNAWLFLAFLLTTASPASLRSSFAAPPQPGASAPTRLAFAIDPAHSALHWTLDTTLHTVHGTFAIKRGELTVDPVSGNATGEIVVDATSGETGNDSRDKKMHQEILETAHFPEIVFRVSQIDGLTAPPSKTQLKVHGTVLIHGMQHDMIIPADADFTDGHFDGTAKFVVPYIAWGIKNPSNFLLKASPTVEVSLELSGTLRPATKSP